MNIALIADDAKKELMVQFCIAYCDILRDHNLFATSSTGRLISEATDLEVVCLLNGGNGGAQQLVSRISCGEVDVVFFFRDAMNMNGTSDDLDILRLSDMRNCPVATNIATGEVLINALKKGGWLRLE